MCGTSFRGVVGEVEAAAFDERQAAAVVQLAVGLSFTGEITDCLRPAAEASRPSICLDAADADEAENGSGSGVAESICGFAAARKGAFPVVQKSVFFAIFVVVTR